MLRSLGDKVLILQADDSRLIKFSRSDKTKFLKADASEMKSSDLKPGDHLTIEGTQDDAGNQSAVNVTLDKAGTEAERAAASQPVDMGGTVDGRDETATEPRGDDDRPILRRKDQPKAAEAAPEPAKAEPSAPAKPQAQQTAAAEDVDNSPATVVTPPPIKDSQDPGPPSLKRGKPAQRSTAASTKEPDSVPQTVTVARNTTADTQARPSVLQAEAPPVATKADLLIARAREAAESYGEALPNYIAQQFTSRYISESHPANWHAQDVVSSEVIYENGRERYRNLAVSGKPTSKSMDQLGGAWSTGEFGTVLLDLFSPATAADFRQRQQTTMGGRPAMSYDFTVEQGNSHWIVRVPSQSVRPGYAGTVWIDKETAKVLRIEMQARRMPRAFPLDTVESAVDYQFVRIGGPEFLLPVHAETLTCVRGTDDCSRNAIDFRNYHKFAGESTIVFDKPEK